MSVATYTAALIAGETTVEKLESAVEAKKLSLSDFAQIITAATAAKSKGPDRALSVKKSEKGCVCVYGLNARFPVSLYADQWDKLAAFLPNVQAFIAADKSLPRK